jgi:hypothetical protein
VAVHAILQVGDAFLAVLLRDLGRLVFMAVIAVEGRQGVSMAGPALVRASTTMVEGEGVRARIARRCPAIGEVAGSTVIAQDPSVEGRFTMAGHTGLRSPGIYVAWMALHASGPGVRAGQLECGQGMVKDGAWPASRVVALGAVLAELAHVLVILCMTSHTVLGRTRVDVTRMALGARSAGVRAR